MQMYKLIWMSRSILFIIKMSMKSQSDNDQSTQILNPEDEQPNKRNITKRKQPEVVIRNVPQRIKFKYTILEKPHRSGMAKIFIIFWLLTMIALLYTGYSQKISQIEISSSQEQKNCEMEYHKNKCEKGLKATQQYCNQMLKCFSMTQEEIITSKMRVGEVVGEILKNFIEGAGIYVCGFGLVMIWTLARKQSEKEVRKQYVEYW